MLSRFLRERLGALIRQGSARASPLPGMPAEGPGSSVTAPERRQVPSPIEEILAGGVLDGPHGSLFVHERLYTDLGEHPGPVLDKFAALCEPAISNGVDLDPHPASAGNGARPFDPAHEPRVVTDRGEVLQRPADLPSLVAQVDWPERGLFRRFGYRRMLFLDIETCALSGAPVFLVGLALLGEGNVVLRQLFARDYAEERALLHELGRTISEADFLITFNGKSFDVPYLRDRAVHYRMGWTIDIPHLDLLWMARRRWKHRLPDCRLRTLEWRVLRRRRAGDVWGYEIPGLYHDYVQRGEAHRLIPVFHHNMLDVVAMVELIPALFDPFVEVY